MLRVISAKNTSFHKTDRHFLIARMSKDPYVHHDSFSYGRSNGSNGSKIVFG
jgi:hypothetical protein